MQLVVSIRHIANKETDQVLISVPIFFLLEFYQFTKDVKTFNSNYNAFEKEPSIIQNINCKNMGERDKWFSLIYNYIFFFSNNFLLRIFASKKFKDIHEINYCRMLDFILKRHSFMQKVLPDNKIITVSLFLFQDLDVVCTKKKIEHNILSYKHHLSNK